MDWVGKFKSLLYSEIEFYVYSGQEVFDCLCGHVSYHFHLYLCGQVSMVSATYFTPNQTGPQFHNRASNFVGVGFIIYLVCMEINLYYFYVLKQKIEMEWGIFVCMSEREREREHLI